MNGNKKLFMAVQNNESITVASLLDSHMFDVNAFDDKQRSCLHIAASRGYYEIVRMLLSYGASPNVRDCVNNFPVHLAIIGSHVPVVTLLLEAGTDIQSLDLNGNTVLHLAGTRLRWLLNDENRTVSPRLKQEAILIMEMIKEYLRKVKKDTIIVNNNNMNSSVVGVDTARDNNLNGDLLDELADKLEQGFSLNDADAISTLSKELLDQFDKTLNLSTVNSRVNGNNNENDNKMNGGGSCSSSQQQRNSSFS